MAEQKTAAYVNHGRWLIDCPDCNTGLQLDRAPIAVTHPKWIFRNECLICHTPIDVDWPDEPDLIDAALSVRPMQVNRNWYPRESIDDLLAENRAHL